MAHRPEDPESWEPRESGPLTRLSTAIVRIALGYAVILLAYSLYSHERWITASSQIRAYLLPAAALLLLTLVLRARPAIRIATALSMIPLVAGVAALNTAFAQPHWGIRRAGVHWLIERRREAVASELRSEGIDAYPYVTPTQLGFGAEMLSFSGRSFLPLSGISRVRTVMCDEGGLIVTYMSDEYGFNNPAGLWPRDSIDVALIGDSFVFGPCVSPRDHFTTIVRDRIPLTLNAGGSGNGPLTELGILREYVSAARPSRVLWFYYEGNDMEDLDLEKSNFVRSYIDSSFTQGLRDRQPTIDSALVVYTEPRVKNAFPGKPLTVRARNLLLLRDLRLGLAPRTKRVSDGDFALLREVLSEAKRSVEGWGGSMTLVYLPERHRTDPDFPLTPARINALDTVHSRVTQIARDLDVHLLDVAVLFAKDPNPRAIWWAPRTHYSPYGNRVLANVVLEYLRQKDEPTVK